MKSLCLVLFLAISTPGCSHFTASERQNRAYTKYIKKSKTAQERRQAQFRRDKAKIPQPDVTAQLEPQVTTQTSEGPQAAPSDPDSQ